MNKSRKNDLKKIQDSIRNLLLQEWDPIGVHDISEAQDEYDSYVLEIYNLLMLGGTKEIIFAYLRNIETEHMGLKGEISVTENAAKLLAKLNRPQK